MAAEEMAGLRQSEDAASLRKDEADGDMDVRELLQAAPAAKPPYFAVPKVLGDVAEEG